MEVLEMARKKYQSYTEEFRREAVKRSEKPKVTQAQVAKELGVSAQQIANWKRQFKRLSDKQFNSLDGVDYSKEESAELRKLRREKAALEKELEFVKKAAAYFANQQE
jgi:transposase